MSDRRPKRRRLLRPQAGDSLWSRRVSPVRGELGDGRHLGCGVRCSPSRERIGSGPRGGCASVHSSGSLVWRLLRGAPIRSGLHPCEATRQRQKGVRVDQVGAKLSRERSRREVPFGACLVGPLACETSVGCGRFTGRCHPQSIAARPGDRECGVRGSVDLAVVFAGRIGCRSRRAARGPSRSRAKSRRIRRWV